MCNRTVSFSFSGVPTHSLHFSTIHKSCISVEISVLCYCPLRYMNYLKQSLKRSLRFVKRLTRDYKTLAMLSTIYMPIRFCNQVPTKTVYSKSVYNIYFFRSSEFHLCL